MVIIEVREGGLGLLMESKLFLEKLNEFLRDKYIMVCCWPLTSSPMIRVNITWLMKLLGKRFMTSFLWVSFGVSVFRQIRGIPASAVFQAPSPQNNHYGQKCTCYGGKFCHSSRTSRLVHRLLMLLCQDHPIQGLFFSLQTKLLNIPKGDWTNSRDSFNHSSIK